ncbi:MAG: MltA domain-containing protein [Desulfobacteraceae bacterium]|nr:MAG: MltA domain-containing protein [Desulfobacteraceae bacterium]
MMSTKKTFLIAFLILTTAGLLGCYPTLRQEAQRPEEALKPVRFFYPNFHDDLDPESLILAINRNLEYLNRLEPGYVFHYGPHGVTSQQVSESQEFFLKLITENPNPDQLNKKLKKHFRAYRAAGRVGNKKVLFTGYFEPIFEADLTSDETYKYPLYMKPDDLLRIDLSLFNEKFQGESITARIEGKKVLPYYSREQIEMEKALEGQDLEIAWLKDPVDVTFLHIQGSGRLILPNGESVSVGYQASNGRPYRSIGAYLLEKGFMEREQMSMQGIRRHLSENPEIMNEVLNHNPSYVFFRILESGPLGNINIPVTPGRSLALDARLFPKGALAFISCQRPIVNDQGKITEWQKFSRFVLNQDTGGAIKGAGRADLFWGSGPYAEIAAGHLKHDGELYILIKKP